MIQPELQQLNSSTPFTYYIAVIKSSTASTCLYVTQDNPEELRETFAMTKTTASWNKLIEIISQHLDAYDHKPSCNFANMYKTTFDCDDISWLKYCLRKLEC
ncbi:Hypothetical protein MVR_LOCUS343 [uncultured virus]|nr:Hypothetical protein MVR_LOCUS343 [uncultured virus]